MLKYLFLPAFLLLAGYSAPTLAAVSTYYAPPQTTQATLELKDKDKDAKSGAFQIATGSFSYDSEKSEITNLKIAISGNTLNAMPSHVLKEMKDLLKIPLFDEITFQQKGITTLDENNTATANGTLFIKGKNIPTEFKLTVSDRSRRSMTLNGLASPSLGGEDTSTTLTVELKAIRP